MFFQPIIYKVVLPLIAPEQYKDKADRRDDAPAARKRAQSRLAAVKNDYEKARMINGDQEK